MIFAGNKFNREILFGEYLNTLQRFLQNILKFMRLRISDKISYYDFLTCLEPKTWKFYNLILFFEQFESKLIKKIFRLSHPVTFIFTILLQ